MKHRAPIPFLIFLVIVAAMILFGYTCSRLARPFVYGCKQQQWQRQKKLKSLGLHKLTTEGYWLSTDPNHLCCDLNFDGYIDFFDYAIFLRNYTENFRGAE